MSGGSGSCGSCVSAFVLIEEAFDELEGIFYRTSHGLVRFFFF